MNEEVGKKESIKEDVLTESQGPDWESDLDVYPLREKTEDPRWAVRTVWIWVGFALVSIAFILTLLVLGAIYD